MKLCFMMAVDREALNDPIPEQVFFDLRRQGFEIEILFAEDYITHIDDTLSNENLYILKAHDEFWLSFAGLLQTQGASILNSYSACEQSRNKIIAAKKLYVSGIPSPRTWVTGSFYNLLPILRKTPLIIKPVIGGQASRATIRIIEKPSDIDMVFETIKLSEEQKKTKSNGNGLARLETHQLIIQEYIPNSGKDLKVYVIGDNVVALRKPFSLTTHNDPGELCNVSEEIRRIALKCGKIFGLNLYGIDLIEGKTGTYVIDINYFPSYSGVPNIANLLTDFIGSYARQHARQYARQQQKHLELSALASPHSNVISIQNHRKYPF